MFKDLIQKDLDIFINGNEFATEHNFNNKKIQMIISNEKLEEYKKRDLYHFRNSKVLFYCKSDDLDILDLGTLATLDNEAYEIIDVSQSDGLCQIILGKGD